MYMIVDLVGPYIRESSDCFEIFLSVDDKLTLRLRNKTNILFV